MTLNFLKAFSRLFKCRFMRHRHFSIYPLGALPEQQQVDEDFDDFGFDSEYYYGPLLPRKPQLMKPQMKLFSEFKEAHVW